jgi:hypothetical protein
MKYLALLFSFSATVCLHAQKHYSDVSDLGFMPGTKKVTCTRYPSPVQKSREWRADSAAEYTTTYTFGRDGKILTKNDISPLYDRPPGATTSVKTGEFSEATKTYHYKDSLLVTAEEITGSEANNLSSRFSHTDTSFTEKVFDRHNHLLTEIVTVLDKNMLTVKEIIRNYKSGSDTLSAYWITRFDNRDEGLLSSWTSTDMLHHKEEKAEQVVLKRDSAGNPLRVIKKKDGMAVWYITYQYEYWKPPYPTRPAAAEINEDPVWVIEAIIDAAKTGDFSQLAKICDPQGRSDKDASTICAVSTSTKEKQELFRKTFRNSVMLDEPRVIDAVNVAIRISYMGVYHEERTVVYLTKAGDRWYVSSM